MRDHKAAQLAESWIDGNRRAVVEEIWELDSSTIVDDVVYWLRLYGCSDTEAFLCSVIRHVMDD